MGDGDTPPERGDLVIDELTLTSPEPDEVMIQTSACGLCHSDLHMIDGHLPTPVPAVLGHEAAGIVQAVGSNVTDFAVRAVSAWSAAPGCASAAVHSASAPTAPHGFVAATSKSPR